MAVFVVRRHILDQALHLICACSSTVPSLAAVQQAACAMLVCPGLRSRPCKSIKGVMIDAWARAFTVGSAAQEWSRFGLRN